MRDLLTEVEAKTKVCPNMTAAIGELEMPTCQASECMAWRWSHQDPGPLVYPTGYCGLAGSPNLRGA